MFTSLVSIVSFLVAHDNYCVNTARPGEEYFRKLNYLNICHYSWLILDVLCTCVLYYINDMLTSLFCYCKSFSNTFKEE